VKKVRIPAHFRFRRPKLSLGSADPAACDPAQKAWAGGIAVLKIAMQFYRTLHTFFLAPPRKGHLRDSAALPHITS
jgi:hypothetical protein